MCKMEWKSTKIFSTQILQLLLVFLEGLISFVYLFAKNRFLFPWKILSHWIVDRYVLYVKAEALSSARYSIDFVETS